VPRETLRELTDRYLIEGRVQIPEVDWQHTVVDLLTVLGYRSMHVRHSVGKGNRWTTTTSVAGWPDLVAWRPGRLVAIELKSARGRVTPEQAQVLEELTDAGVECRVARPADFHDPRAWLQ
jgi:hypothetical protein